METLKNTLHTTKVLLKLGLDGSPIIGSAYPSFGFGGRNSTGHWFLTSAFVC
jgi:hypothetical protein